MASVPALVLALPRTRLLPLTHELNVPRLPRVRLVPVPAFVSTSRLPPPAFTVTPLKAWAVMPLVLALSVMKPPPNERALALLIKSVEGKLALVKSRASVPLLTFSPPVKVLTAALLRVSVPRPIFVIAPPPSINPVSVRLAVGMTTSKAPVPLLAMVKGLLLEVLK